VELILWSGCLVLGVALAGNGLACCLGVGHSEAGRQPEPTGGPVRAGAVLAERRIDAAAVGGPGPRLVMRQLDARRVLAV
jgi:hypothetical protein